MTAATCIRRGLPAPDAGHDRVMVDLSRLALERLGDRVPAPDRTVVERMLRWFDRSSLWLATAEGTGEDLVVILANEAERFRVPLAQLRALHAGMDRGERVDWDSLERVR